MFKRAERAMVQDHLAPFLVLTILLTLGLSVVLSTAYRANVRANWDKYRCDPGVVLTSGLYRPLEDPRSDAEFARANAEFCRKEFIQDAIRTAAQTPVNLAKLQASTVAIVDAAVEDSADVFVHVWKFCYEAYSSFMDNMKGAGKLFQNFMIQMYTIVQRLQTSVLAIVFGLIALITAFISSIQLVLIVAIVIIGIVIALQIILFFLLLPISGLIVTMTALISTVVISVGTAIAAATVSEMFDGGAATCFVTGTPIRCADGMTRPIETLHVGSPLADGCRVTAVHAFKTVSELFELGGVQVTGDHLVEIRNGKFIAVRDHPFARSIGTRESELWCLTTSTRRIPVDSPFIFADWEEIPEDDVKALAMWRAAVWRRLNGNEGNKGNEDDDGDDDGDDGDAGFTPNTRVLVRDGTMRPMRDIQLGDRILDGSTWTTVVGKVVMEGDMETDMIRIGDDAWATKATWVFDGHRWSPPRGDDIMHPARLMHLYTKSGTFTVEGRLHVRDASEVGLAGLKSLVDDIVLCKSPQLEETL